MVTLTRAQYLRLVQHAAAQAITPEEALQTLLDQEPITSSRAHRPWSEDELDAIRNPANSPRAIARTYGRTTSAVSNKRYELARTEGRTNLQRRRKPPAKPLRPKESTDGPA